MSINKAEYQRERKFTETLNRIGKNQQTLRAMQPQGSQALDVVTIWGYRTLAVPPNADTINTTSIDISAVDTSKIAIATILHSTFMKYDDGTIINADLESHGIGDDVYRVWLNYDGRADMGEYWLIPFETTLTPDEIMMETAGSSSIEHHRARVTFAVYRLEDAAPPSDLDEYLIFFQVRLILG